MNSAGASFQKVRGGTAAGETFTTAEVVVTVQRIRHVPVYDAGQNVRTENGFVDTHGFIDTESAIFSLFLFGFIFWRNLGSIYSVRPREKNSEGFCRN